jgi:hypothetical protein
MDKSVLTTFASEDFSTPHGLEFFCYYSFIGDHLSSSGANSNIASAASTATAATPLAHATSKRTRAGVAAADGTDGMSKTAANQIAKAKAKAKANTSSAKDKKKAKAQSPKATKKSKMANTAKAAKAAAKSKASSGKATKSAAKAKAAADSSSSASTSTSASVSSSSFKAALKSGSATSTPTKPPLQVASVLDLLRGANPGARGSASFLSMPDATACRTILANTLCQNKHAMALTEWEWDNLLGYLTKYGQCTGYMLNQHYEKRPIIARPQRLNTLIRNTTLLWVKEAGLLKHRMILCQFFLRIPYCTHYLTCVQQTVSACTLSIYETHTHARHTIYHYHINNDNNNNNNNRNNFATSTTTTTPTTTTPITTTNR